NLPNSSTIEKYYRYLSRPDTATTNQPGLYQVAPIRYRYDQEYFPIFGYSPNTISYDNGIIYNYGMNFNIILHNDEPTFTYNTLYNNNFQSNLLDKPFHLVDMSVMTIQSDQIGTTRKITTDTSLFNVEYNSQLIISNDIIISKDQNSNYSGGAILLQGGILDAQNVTFLSCSNENFSGGSNENFDGGAITANSEGYYYYRNFINVDEAKFTDNRSTRGGAIYLSQSDLFGNKTLFSGNSASKNEYRNDDNEGSGGAIYLSNSNATLENATFENNTANGSGGAIYSQNSNLYLKGTNFRFNNATSLGGAIFFEVSDTGSYTLQLGAFQGSSVEFVNNKQFYNSTTNTGDANSIMFSGYSTPAGTANVSVDVEGNGNNFNMRDPMSVIGGNIHLRFTKTGEGAWNLYGNSNLNQANSVLFNIDRGTFQLDNGAGLNIVNALGIDQFNVRNKATLSISDSANSGNAVTLSTPHFQMDAGSTLQLDQDLNLSVYGNENVINGTVTGTGNLNVNVIAVTEDQKGTLKFSGQTSNYSGDLDIQLGEFWVDSSFETTGSVKLETDTILAVTANSNATNIIAQDITIGSNTTLQINGIVGTTETFCVLEWENSLTGDFTKKPEISSDVDYLQRTFELKQDQKKYLGTVELTWYAEPDNNNGTFTIDPSGGNADYFKVGAVLSDTTPSGKKLTKAGLGTLELANANTYKGGTQINEGTLLLTNAKGTGTGNVVVERNATLALNFNDQNNNKYQQEISGAGQVTKTGAGTVILTNTGNSYSGGTRLEEGTLSINNGKVLGKGDLTFAGGVLQTDSSSQVSSQSETVLTQNITATDGHDVLFATETDLKIAQNSTISGQGGIEKTGRGKLTIAGVGGYHGITHIKEGTLSIASTKAIGSGKIVLDDGIVFENTAAIDNDHNITLNAAAADTSGINVQKTNNSGVIFNVQDDWNQSGSIIGDGLLVKNGTGIMTLSGNNSYSGGTQIKTGTLEFYETKNLGSGQITFAGGTLRNLQTVDDFSVPMTTASGHSFLLDTPHDLTITSRLNGSGGLIKTGSGTLTLTANNDYWDETQIKAGTFKVDGELTRSKVTIYSDAVLTGSGIIDNDVNFKSGAVYQWNFGIREEDSPYLNIRGTVNLSGAVFQPVTVQDAAQEHYPDVIDGWTVLRYGMLEDDAGFASIDNELSPFYDFTLDYSTPYRINVIGYHRRNPRPLSDSVAMGIVLPQRKVSRRAFEQIDNELQNGRYLGLRSIFRRQNQNQNQSQVRGQSPASPASLSSLSVRHVWGNFYGRTSEFESSYHTNDSWHLNSFGLQVGYSFLSTNWLSLGVTAGVEIPQLKNGRDKIDVSDGFLGLYFGKRIYGLWELKGYLGGGTQNYTSYRNDTKYTYRAKYRGDSFETNIELGRPILFGTYLVRPHFGFDFEYAGQQGTTESKVSSEYRTYSNVSLTQLYFRVGIDVEKRLPLGEVFLGIDYANMIGGQSLPSVKVYYPAVKSGTTVYGTTLGQNIVSIRGGGNYYLNALRNKSLFMNLTGDIFADRAGGQCGFTATFGYDCRF
ncbi:MAG: autotransporter-associated beta strand repeat-containing protein, partial [Planctomycetaceae bacterium]|nr:autotransporter-associated beta strand repeat-containing protein [Planctomycetaceae bacterium]